MIANPLVQFVLAWVDDDGGEAVHTLARLSVRLNGRPIWPADGEPDVAVEIYVDDLLSHLTEFWKPLMLRQTFPVAGAPNRPSQIRAVAEQRWAELPPAIVEQEEEKLTAFEQAHDLSRAFAGVYDLPFFYMFRAADVMVLETPWGEWTAGFAAVAVALADLGDQIAQRLGGIGDRKWSSLIKLWGSRDQGNPARLLAWVTGLDTAFASSLMDEGVLNAPASVSEAANDDDELRLAARLSSALSPSRVRQILKLVQGFQAHQAERLDHMAQATADHVRSFSHSWPFEQGQAAAAFVRRYRDLASKRVDVFGLIEDLGVELHTPLVEPPSLDGLAVWGPRHGPAVLVNAGGSRMAGRGDLRSRGAARFTAAHELCHLLLDRGHALTAVDVLNSKMPATVEKRANAFAGELLLPGSDAAEVWVRMQRPLTEDGLDRCVKRLCSVYLVTRSVAAWKLEHGLRLHNVDVCQQLDQIVPQRRWRAV